MTTWQSKCGKKRHGRPQPTPEQRREAQARADERRMALPAPIYPPDRKAGQWRGYILIVLDGVETRIELHQGPASRGRRPRCDSLQSRMDGRDLATGGLHAICRQMIGHEVPHALPRAAYACLDD